MQLMPGLPNELAMEVLLRLPAHFHTQAMEVNSLWRIVLCSDRFYVLVRLRYPYPSLILLFKGLHSCKHANSPMYQIFDFDAANPSSVAPRLLFSSQACPLSSLAFPDLNFDCCVSLSNTSFLVLDVMGHAGWMQFNMLSRQWTRFGMPGTLPFHFQVEDIYLLGLLGSRVFLLASTAETPSRKVALSYDYITHCWDIHHGLPEPFYLDRMRLTFQGQIFVRNNVEDPIVYSFDSSTNSWKEHVQMTERLLTVPSWSRVVATLDGTLICVIQVSPGILEVRQQDAGRTKWRNLLQIETGGRIRVEFYLFVKDEHILLVMEGPRDDTRITRCQEHLVGQRRLTCIFVPYFVLMGAVLING